LLAIDNSEQDARTPKNSRFESIITRNIDNSEQDARTPKNSRFESIIISNPAVTIQSSLLARAGGLRPYSPTVDGCGANPSNAD
jgi:hypothetical protein